MRRLTLQDTAFMLDVWNDPAFIRHVGDRGMRTTEQAETALRDGVLRLYDDYGYGPFCMVLRDSAMPVGICGLFRRDNLEHPDVGFAVLPEFRGEGLAGEAAVAVIEHARDALGLHVLMAIVAPDNDASVNLIEKLGFSFERGITMPGDDEQIRLYRMRLSRLIPE
jgi:RimJ/RimL family protein N-acetyltransferase